jgi:O-antigen/teichoic acid export membrane protein
MLKKSEFAKNSILLVVGTGLSQLLPLAVQPYLRRVFSDEEFGLFAQYFSVVSIIAIIAGLKYESSIVIPKSDRSARHLLSGTIFFNLCTSFILLIVLFLVGKQLFGAMSLSAELHNYFWLMPISVFLISTNVALNYWLTRKKRFKGIVLNKVSRRTSEAVARVGFGARLVAGGLILGTLIGDFVNLLVSLFQFKKSEGTFKDISKEEVKKQLKEQDEFPKYALVPSVLNVISSQLPIFLFAAFYSDAIVGQFNGSRELLSAPLALISISLSQVLYQRLVEDVNNDRKILRLIRNNIFFLGGLSVLGVLIVTPFGVEIFTFIFGDNWVLSGEISQILVFSYAIKFIVSPLSMTFIALKRMKIAAIWQVGYFLLTLNLLWFDNLSTYDFVLCIVAIDLVSYLVYGLLIWRVAKQQDQKIDLILKNKSEEE